MHCDIGGSVELELGNAANFHLGAAISNEWLPSVCPVSKSRGRPGPEIAGFATLMTLLIKVLNLKTEESSGHKVLIWR